MTHQKKILIIRLSSIGDIVLTTPFTRAVRKKFPDAKIDFLTKKEYQDLLIADNNIDRVISFDSSLGLKGLKECRQMLRLNDYDIVFDLHDNQRSLYLKKGLAPEIYRYRKKRLKRILLVKTGINLIKVIEPIFLRYFSAGKKLGIEYDGYGTEIIISDLDRNKVSSLLAQDQGDKTIKYIAMSPGAAYATKRWLPERFAKTGIELAEKYQASILLLGGEDDMEICSEINKMMNGKAIDLSGRLTLTESAAALKKSKVNITNDTGLLHIAQAVDTPVVAFFGSSVQELGFGPLPGKSVLLESRQSCRPCSHVGRDTCPKGHFNCMNDISSQSVLTAVESIMNI